MPVMTCDRFAMSSKPNFFAVHAIAQETFGYSDFVNKVGYYRVFIVFSS